MNIRPIITGATGMVGEGVLLTCLAHAEVEKILVIGRRPCGLRHEKLKEIVTNDFSDLSAHKDTLTGYDSCFFCLGTTSIGKSEEEYAKTTYGLTLGFAKRLCAINPDMTFCYVSGSGTDSSQQGRVMWARVKGKTENDLHKLPFKAEYNFRPGYLHPVSGQKNILKFYPYISWLFPLLRPLVKNFASTLEELALAMIAVSQTGYRQANIEVKDIHSLASTL